ncbi:MAG: 5-(carboxyamino)imidazole ribonucleotide mutase [Spirochaetes bacterium]|nr:5-(carboxyamino)imidazole ribonucleotide mutase [Spirochaetota bacterium]
MPQVGIIVGSDSDLPKLKGCFQTLDDFGVSYDVKAYSAHRTPHLVAQWIQNMERSGAKVIIAAAGGAAHLPGVVASHTVLPVIGIPIETQVAGGLDSLLSIVQMPGGIPVATVATGKAGATNAALLAISILATSDSALKDALMSYRQKMQNTIIEKNEALTKQGIYSYIQSLEAKK